MGVEDSFRIDRNVKPSCDLLRFSTDYIKNNNDNTFKLDKCTQCTCKNNLLFCERKKCPPLVVTCASNLTTTTTTESDCCPKCEEEPRRRIDQLDIHISSNNNNHGNKWSCIDSDDRPRPHGKNWKENECVHCTCLNGERKCIDHSKKCKPLRDCEHQVFVKGECCAKCLMISSPKKDAMTDFNWTLSAIILALMAAIALASILACLIFNCFGFKSFRNAVTIDHQQQQQQQKQFTHLNNINEKETKVVCSEETTTRRREEEACVECVDTNNDFTTTTANTMVNVPLLLAEYKTQCVDNLNNNNNNSCDDSCCLALSDQRDLDLLAKQLNQASFYNASMNNKKVESYIYYC